LQSPEIRQGTVDALKQAVSTGQYEIDPAKIASAIAEHGGK
jgi:anti-sigma28 factor (negative regulator of flagellin synthesis)